MSRLLPSNRKVRHLHGISLRNLALIKTTRPRGHTIDDESVPTTLSSPAKILAQKEGRLGHSQSFSDLKSSAIEEEIHDGNANGNSTSGSPQKSKSKRAKTLRRRSTLTWSHETPENRQRLMQDAVAERRVDSFFTLHDPIKNSKEDNPVYISEMKQKFMNPEFQHFDLSSVQDMSRLDRIIVKVWAARSDSEFVQLIEADVELPSLVWLGRNLEDFDLPFSDNAIIFYMTDGVYTLMDHIPDIHSFLNLNLANSSVPRTATLPPMETSTFDALMKLKDLTDLIEDAANTQASVCKQIEAIIQDNKDRTGILDAATSKYAAAEAAKTAANKERSEVERLRDKKAHQLQNLQDRRVEIITQRQAQIKAEDDLLNEQASLQNIRSQQESTRIAHTGQIRRVAQELLDIYPIEPIPGYSLCFTIRGLYLPNAIVFEDDFSPKPNLPVPPNNPEATAAALSFVAHIVQKLELYLGIALPYEPSVCGSTSTIFDALSSARDLGLSTNPSIPARSNTTEDPERPIVFHPPTIQTHPYRSFPLYQYSTQPKRFRWAIYLLNKDIEELTQNSGCKVVDPRGTLANLKYLLTVLVSGKGEVGRRKVGIVRGLDEGN